MSSNEPPVITDGQRKVDDESMPSGVERQLGKYKRASADNAERAWRHEQHDTSRSTPSPLPDNPIANPDDSEAASAEAGPLVKSPAQHHRPASPPSFADESAEDLPSPIADVPGERPPNPDSPTIHSSANAVKTGEEYNDKASVDPEVRKKKRRRESRESSEEADAVREKPRRSKAFLRRSPDTKTTSDKSGVVNDSGEALEGPKRHRQTKDGDDGNSAGRKRERRERPEAPKDRSDERNKGTAEEKDAADWFAQKRKEKIVDPLKMRSGGAYIPPAKLKMLQEQISDKTSDKYQRLAWEALKKRIHGKVNRVNTTNVQKIVVDLLQENIIRGKGLLARDLIQAQAFSPSYSHVYAALVAVVNTRFPNIGELILRRLVISFKRSFRRNDKATTVNVSKFIAHLVNQEVAHEILALEILTILLEKPTDDSVEVAIALLKECGQKLGDVCSRGLNIIFERLRSILHEAEIDLRIQYMIEAVFVVRKDKFQAHPAVLPELDLIEDEDDKITHTMSLEEVQDPETSLNIFHYDADYEKSEEMYNTIKQEILGDLATSDAEGEEEEESDEEEQAADEPKQQIIDMTETNLIAFRRTIYLTLQSSLDYNEAAHKLLKLDIKPGMEGELCDMFLDTCAQQRTYERFYGLITERFCRLRREYQQQFERIFQDTYSVIHRFEIKRLRNVSRLFSHLFCMDAISWSVMSCIKLNEDDTTSSGRIFLKVLFQDMAENMGIQELYGRFCDPTMSAAFEGIFPRDNPRDTRFAINYFVSIDLGGLTTGLRDFLMSAPKQPVPGPSSSSESDSTDSSSSDSSESDADPEPQRKPRQKSSPVDQRDNRFRRPSPMREREDRRQRPPSRGEYPGPRRRQEDIGSGGGSRRMEREEPSRRMEREEPSRRAEREEPSRRMEREEPSRRMEREEPSRRMEREEPSRRMEREEPPRRKEAIERRGRRRSPSPIVKREPASPDERRERRSDRRDRKSRSPVQRGKRNTDSRDRRSPEIRVKEEPPSPDSSPEPRRKSSKKSRR